MTQIAQVVIIGAGLSSLRAAREVHNAGLSYIVLEAMGRVGGKTSSVQASEDNGVVDIGVSWINDPSQTYRDENGEVHCISVEMPANLKEVDQFKQLLSEYVEKCDIDNPSDGPDTRPLDSITVAEFIAGFKDPGASALANSITRSLLGVESDEPSALFFLDILKRNRQGNQSFRDRLAAGLNAGSVKVSSAVKAIT
ncbi:hypothetical protein FPRO06_10077 [Fusarium proliferatum]|nr:hypothetical protein FPRO06_10077 [Fusarium proliferatum]